MAIKELQYEEIEKLVMRYQDGDNEAGLEILEKCRVFTDKFKNLICKGKTDLSNRSIRAFTKLFIPSYVNANLHLYNKSNKAWIDANNAADHIQQKFYMYEDVEIDNIIAVVILGLAKKYRNNGRNNFYAYLSSCFHFRLMEQLMILVDDTTNLCYINGNDYHENLIEASTTDEYDLNTHSPAVQSLIVDEETDEVGNNWLMGHDCEIFAELTPFERKFIMLKFEHGLTDEEVGEILGVCRHTVHRRKLKLLPVLEKLMTEKKLLKG